MGPSLARRLERALTTLERGSTLIEALWAGLALGLSRHGSRPVDWKARAELEAALRAVQRLRAGPHPTPRPEFRAAARERIVAAARASGRPPVVALRTRRRTLIRRLLPFAATLALVGSGAIASFVALPSGTAFADALAPAIEIVERVQLATVPDDDARARLSLTIAERRRTELESAASAGQFDRAASIAARYTASLAAASEAGVASGSDTTAEKLADESQRGAATLSRVAESAPSPIAVQIRSLAASRPAPTTNATATSEASAANAPHGEHQVTAPRATPTTRSSRDGERRADKASVKVATPAADLAAAAREQAEKRAATPPAVPSVRTESAPASAERPPRDEKDPATATAPDARGEKKPAAAPTAKAPAVAVPTVKAPVPKVPAPAPKAPTPKAPDAKASAPKAPDAKATKVASPTPRAQSSPAPQSASDRIGGWLRLIGR